MALKVNSCCGSAEPTTGTWSWVLHAKSIMELVKTYTLKPFRQALERLRVSAHCTEKSFALKDRLNCPANLTSDVSFEFTSLFFTLILFHSASLSPCIKMNLLGGAGFIAGDLQAISVVNRATQPVMNPLREFANICECALAWPPGVSKPAPSLPLFLFLSYISGNTNHIRTHLQHLSSLLFLFSYMSSNINNIMTHQ